MPRLTTEMDTHQIGGNFNFTGARITNLGATEYTLATIMVDLTGSLSGHEGEILDMLIAAVQACQKSPRSDNLLLRVCSFSSRFGNGVREEHGFKPLADIDPAHYAPIVTGGMTPLYDACYSGIGAANAYAKQMTDQDFLVNAITFIITDGDDNTSTMTPAMVKQEMDKALSGEALESHVSILIGLGTSAALQRFKTEACLTQFIDAGAVTKGKLAKLAAFVSQSVSSTSQALGTGGPSQKIAAVI